MPFGFSKVDESAHSLSSTLLLCVCVKTNGSPFTVSFCTLFCACYDISLSYYNTYHYQILLNIWNSCTFLPELLSCTV